MYDLPSEDPQEPGLPDEFHYLQPQLLNQSLRLDDYASDRIFTGSNINIADRLTSPSDRRPLPPYTLEEDETGIAPPPKWDVYEQVLRVPHYVVYNRYTNQLWYFWRGPEGYQEVSLAGANPRAWLADLKVGLGIWHGEFAGITRHWLRWYDAAGNWLPTVAEAAEERLLRVAKKLLATGMDPQQVADMLELPESQVMELG